MANRSMRVRNVYDVTAEPRDDKVILTINGDTGKCRAKITLELDDYSASYFTEPIRKAVDQQIAKWTRTKQSLA